MAGDADDRIRSDDPPRRRVSRVLLAYVHAIAFHFGGEVRPVVEHKRYVAFLGDRPQYLADPPHSVVVRLLQPQLHASHVAGVESCR